MLESLSKVFFKYRPVVFENGRFVFEASSPVLIMLLALAAILAMAVLYRRRQLEPRGFAVLAGLRAAAVLLLVFAMLGPALRVSTAVPGENFLAVVIDDSRSMRLADEDEKPRGTRALELFTAPTSRLRERLEERFTLRYYRFSERASRLDPAYAPAFDGSATDLAAALDLVRRDMSGIPLAGTVLVTDGADNASVLRSSASSEEKGLNDALLQLASRGIPVYTVGLGAEDIPFDVEVKRVQGPERVTLKSSFAVDVTVSQQGFEDEPITLVVEKDGAIVTTEEVTFGRGQGETVVRVSLEAEGEGAGIYRFRVDPYPRERVVENNVQELLLMVEDRREKILWVEGEPRWEVAFLRRAIAGDDNLALVLLQRSAPNKYMRLGVEDPLDLISGFPETREELFEFRGLILGSVEASFFTDNQLRIIEEFVSQRGGGLLVLGGRYSFAEGGWAGTPLESVFPVVLEPAVPDDFLEVQVALTPAGAAHAALKLGADDEASAERWANLPVISTRNRLRRLKPGASTLLLGTSKDDDDDVVVLASQRYGRGRAVAFAVQDSWQWKMHADIPAGDPSHGRLWRQLLRWLVSSVPRQVEVQASKSRVTPGEEVILTAEVNDAAFLGLNGARVSATVTDPTGAEETLPLEWTVEEDGEYRARFVPEQMGPYEIRVDAEDAGEAVGSDRIQVEAADLPTEFFDAEMNAPLLRRIAGETGGRFYTAANVDGLAEDVRFTESGKTVTVSYDLWDMPIILLLLLGAVSTEWLLRRRRGLA